MDEQSLGEKYSRFVNTLIFISSILLTLGHASYSIVNFLLGDIFIKGSYVYFLAIFLLLANKSIKTSEV
jgi:hypothetical protein